MPFRWCCPSASSLCNRCAHVPSALARTAVQTDPVKFQAQRGRRSCALHVSVSSDLVMRHCKEYAPERGKDLSRAEAQAETQTPKSLSGCRGSGHDLPSCTSHGFAVQAMKQKARQARVKPHLACRSIQKGSWVTRPQLLNRIP